ncbi:phage tail domain-containing protein [Limosilactobacillus equigenerosi]|uniref:Siphovirus-type tail component RIFT-related domain-containing protein n=1 Tax=Limosilactobacillus equigenerosi DSM 18793 = JCM 14505 TaxID=1423742 RepID=A0A0R1UEH1_9LACO|nr:phage tail domain-containing protein [Limosilactobacillus equigenerosi]KRL91846.1 hypothetical protein FC21_GL000616 [Limosilactobacillus equigenerosi DSM 18793 = JCM 14505]
MTEIIIQKNSGKTYNLNELGFKVTKFDIPLNNNNFTYQQIANYSASLQAVQNQQQALILAFNVIAKDKYDYQLQLLKLREIFGTVEPLYVINSDIPYLRWKAYPESVTPSREGNFWRASNVEVNLDVPDGYAETTESTGSANFKFEDGKWGFGENIPSGVKPHYHFVNQNKMDVWNLGLIPLRSDERPVLITFKGSVGKELKITNNTTKQSIKITKEIKSGDTLKITGFVPILNDTEIYEASDHGYLDFVPGKNEIVIEGAGSSDITFDTHFYY